MAEGRHGGRVTDRAGVRDVARDSARTTWVPMRYGTWRGLQVGRVYTFDNGRRGKILEKRENSGSNSSGLPSVKVEWRN